MSQNQNDDFTQDAAETTDDAQRRTATPQTDDTQVLATGEGDTQVLDPTPADPDEPLSVFDQPAAGAYSAASAAGGTSAAPSPSTSYPTAGYQTPPPSYTTAPSAYTGPASTGPAYEPVTWTAPPKPLVKTTPRTGTIVWGFIILAIGIGAISVAAGATVDITLAMIWLLAAAGAVLVVASIVGAARRRGRTEGSARA